MRKLRISVAILVVLFACQAVFAGFVPVQKADPAVTAELAVYCDALQTAGLEAADPVGFYKEMALIPEETFKLLIPFLGEGSGYKSVTTMDELALIFPRGVEETDSVNAFRRAAIHLAAYTARNGNLHSTETIKEAEKSFKVVGYGFVGKLVEGKTIQFKFVDIYSDVELAMIGAALAMNVQGIQDVAIPRSGEIDFSTSGITEFGFDAFMAYAESLMYRYFYNI